MATISSAPLPVSPFLTLPDPKTAGEGKLDPMGLATIGDRLAERLLPGLRVRMLRPRFLTAMAVCARVCEVVSDDSESETPAYLVFEWLLVEAFARDKDRNTYLRTPGIGKAQEVLDSDGVMSAKTYLRVPTVFGFNGVYKPLGDALDLVREVDERFHLGDAGYELLRVWQNEQNLAGFLDSALGEGPGSSLLPTLRAAVQDGVRQGYTKRSSSWIGWSELARHLAPSRMGAREKTFLFSTLASPDTPLREEVFRLMRASKTADESEAELARRRLVPRASGALRAALNAIEAFEALAVLLEESFDWIRFLSTTASGRAITSADFAKQKRCKALVSGITKALDGATRAMDAEDVQLQQAFTKLARAFDKARSPAELFEATLAHHSEVQKAKLPDGKREWFERDAAGATFVRVPYRLPKMSDPVTEWGRPYRLTAVDSFLSDFGPAR